MNASAVQIVIQAKRLPGGKRKVTSVTEIVGLEGDNISTHDLFMFEQSGVDELRIVDLKDVDPRLARETAADADAILAADPTLERPEHAGLATAVEALWRRYALA